MAVLAPSAEKKVFETRRLKSKFIRRLPHYANYQIDLLMSKVEGLPFTVSLALCHLIFFFTDVIFNSLSVMLAIYL